MNEDQKRRRINTIASQIKGWNTRIAERESQIRALQETIEYAQGEIELLQKEWDLINKDLPNA